MRDLSTLDLNLLKALDALLDERNVTRAAARLKLTQPAMSGILVRLRESFGDQLFVRAQRGIAPTERALALAQPVRQVLSEIDALLQAPLFDPATSTMTVTIAATDYAQRAIAVRFFSALAKRAPRIRMALVALDDATLPLQLERGEIDLALMTAETAPAGLHGRRLFDERYVCVMRAGHPLALAKRLSVKQFCAHEHALVSMAGGGFWGVTDDALAAIGHARTVTVSVKNFLILPDLLRASDLLAVVPRRLVDGLDGLVTRAPPVDVPGFTKIAVWHARTHSDPRQRWLRALLVETCAQPDQAASAAVRAAAIKPSSHA